MNTRPFRTNTYGWVLPPIKQIQRQTVFRRKADAEKQAVKNNIPADSVVPVIITITEPTEDHS